MAQPGQTQFNESKHKRDGGKFAKSSGGAAGPAMKPSNRPRPKPKPRPRAVQGFAPADVQALSAQFAALSGELAKISNQLGGTRPPRATGTRKAAAKKAPAKKAAKKTVSKVNKADAKKMESAAARSSMMANFHKFLGS